MSIQFACQCGKTLKAADEHAGKRAKCKQCGQIVTIPAAPKKVAAAAAMATLPVATSAPKAVAVQSPKAVTTSKPKAASQFDIDEFLSADIPPAQPIAVTSSLTPAAAPVKSNSVRPCPSCQKPISANAVLCVNCGYNLKTGQKTTTFAYAPSTYKETPQKRRSQSRIMQVLTSRLTSWKVWSGLGTMALSAAWFFFRWQCGRINFYAIFLFFGGVISLINGLFDGDAA